MMTPSRREMMSLAAAGVLLPKPALAKIAPVPLVAAYPKEAWDVRDKRFGKGLSADYRAILPLGAQNKRVWLDTNAAADGTGKTAASPFKSEAKAYAAVVGGDQLMIASGSVLTRSLGELKNISGLNSGTPTVIQSYDRTAPTNETRYGLLTNKVTYRGETAYVRAFSSAAASFIAIRGILFDHSGVSGMQYLFTSGINWLLIEQCVFLGAQLSLNAGRGSTVHVLRQTAFQGQWSTGGKAQGIFTQGNYDTVIEDCIFHHCGWKMGAARGDAPKLGGATMFSHGIYAAVQSGGTVRRCVFVDPASHGAQLRGNWHSHHNVFLSCPLALLHGGGTTYADPEVGAPNGVMARAYRNVISIGEDINPDLPRGYGINVANTRAGSVVEQNLIVAPSKKEVHKAMYASATAGAGYEPNPTLVTFQRNTNAWLTSSYVGSGKDRVFVAENSNIIPDDKVTFVNPKCDGLSAAKDLGYKSISALGAGMVANPTAGWAMKMVKIFRLAYAPVGLKVKAGVPFKGAVLPTGAWNNGVA